MRADFYLLAEQTAAARWQFACRLADKAYQQKQGLLLWCEDQATAHHIDELLWTYSDLSFIPHNLVGEGPMPPPPIQVGFGDALPNHQRQTVINLTNQPITSTHHFARIIELICATPEATETGREHFRYYRQQGLSLFTHDLRKGVTA